MQWFEFGAALAVFLLSHMVPLRLKTKGRLVETLGHRGFTIIYSGLSVAVLAWLIVATGRAPFVMLWEQRIWHSWVPLVVMLPVCLILTCGLGRPNPFSFGGARNDMFDQRRPGMVQYIRHPVLAALFLWALAHIVPNGNLAHVVLFGLFAGFAAIGTKAIDGRKQRQMGQTAWTKRWGGTRLAKQAWQDILPLKRLLLGCAIYGALIAVHPLVIGASPLPS